MSRRPIQGGFDAGRDPEPHDPGEGVSAEEFKEALSWWAATVTVVAARDAGRILATTATSFAPVSARPPLVVVSLGAGAQVLPPLKEGAPFAISLLARDQRRVASVYADSFPVGPTPFPTEGPPVVEGAVGGLVCRAASVHPVEGGSRLVVGRVEEILEGRAEEPLLYWRRTYCGVDAG